MRPVLIVLSAVLFLSLLQTASAGTTWYVNGVTGRNTNNCTSSANACKTIRRAISLSASGDVIRVAAATYNETLTVGKSLSIIGSGARRTFLDGGLIKNVLVIAAGVRVGLSGLTIQHGAARFGAGINNAGTLMVTNSSVVRNIASDSGGGISNTGTLTINGSTVSGNVANGSCNNPPTTVCLGFGGGIMNLASLKVINTTIAENTAKTGSAIYNSASLKISNSTLAENSLLGGSSGSAGIVSLSSNGTASALLQNSILENNSRRNCTGTMTSAGYNLSSDSTCDFNSPGDFNQIDAMVGPLQNNGGPTQTYALPSDSPAIDSGNPNGCTDGTGHRLTHDQRGQPRPDPEDTAGCDIGSYEFQSSPKCIPIGGSCYGPGPLRCCPAPFPHHSFCSNPNGFGTCLMN